MKESVIYQEILRTGEQRGISIGEQIGEEKTAIKWITSLLTHQLGQVDSSLREQI
jgi:predicted transposase YdaD